MYAINGTVHGGADPGCNFSNAISGQTPAPPADCIQTKNGVATGPFDSGICNRFVGTSNCNGSGQPSAGGQWYCPNNFSRFDPSKPFDNLPTNDDRIVELFIAPYNGFSTSGNTLFPIQDFAFFYVAGFVNDPCNSDPARPSGATQSRMWGYFIKYTSPTGNGNPGVACSASAFGACTTELTQ
jgi:hypothetical protein